MKIDLKHFKKVGQTRTHTIMEHPEGHTIHIAHASLTPEHKRDAKNLHMADGGKVPVPGPKLDQTEVKKFIKGTGFSEGGEVDPMAEPKEPEKDEHARKMLYHQEELSKLQAQVPQKPMTEASKKENYAEGGPVEPVQPQPAPSQDQGLLQQLRPQAGVQANPEVIPQQDQSANPAQGSLPVEDVFGKATLAKAEAQNLGEQAAVASQQGEAKAGELGAIAKVKEREAHTDENAAAAVNNLMQARRNELEAAEKDMNNGHFHPRSLFDHRNGTWNNILTGVGLILGGRGLGGKLIDVVQKQIDADNAGDTRAFEAMKEQFGNDQDALKMMNIYKTAAFANQLQAETAKAQTPEARLAGQQAVLQVSQGLNQKIQEAATQEYFNKARQNSIQGGSPNESKSLQQAGLMVQGIPDEKARGEAMKELKQQANISHVNKNALESFDQVAKLSTLKNRASSPVQTQKLINAAWEPMLDKVVKTAEGRVTPITVDLMKSLKPSLTDDQKTLDYKRKKFESILNSERAAPTLETYSIRLPGAQQQLSGDQGQDDFGFKPKK